MTDPRFPRLTKNQIIKLKRFGVIESFENETLIFSFGDLNYDFFVVLEGGISIQEESEQKEEIVVHGPYEFSGDTSMLSSKKSQFNGYALKDSLLIRINSTKLSEIISKQSDIGDILLSAFMQRQETMLKEFNGGIKIIGTDKSKETYELRDFMEKNHIWHSFYNTKTSAEAKELIRAFNLTDNELPIIVDASGQLLKKPTISQLAEHTGVLLDFGDEVYDLLIIGAGPAGLAASVYGSSEGLNVITIDANAPGGQAGKSSKIENYLGFPTGISGNDLANKAHIQAQKFGCHISIPHKAKDIEYRHNHFVLTTFEGKKIKAKSVIAATGANYRKLPLSNIEKFEGRGIYYSATNMNASSCKNEIIGVIGGGNSAGQAVLFLAEHAKKAHIIIRGNDLGSKMSDYLVKRIENTPNIEIHKNTNVVELNGELNLESIVINKASQQKSILMSNLFTFIGAKPCSEWLNNSVVTDKKGFILTGKEVSENLKQSCSIYEERNPQSLETSLPGFFAVGDIRKGSVKRVASAVGEGSMAISQVHQYLADLRTLN